MMTISNAVNESCPELSAMASKTSKATVTNLNELVARVLAERHQNGVAENELDKAYTGFEYADELLREMREKHFKKATFEAPAIR